MKLEAAHRRLCAAMDNLQRGEGRKMMNTRTLLVAIGVILTATAATAGVQFDLYYGFEVGARTETRVSAQIDNVEMGPEVPLAVTGEAAVDLDLEVVEVNDEGVAVIRATFGEIDATLMGDRQPAKTPSPVALHVDSKGQLLEIVSEDEVELDLFAGGGIPLQLIVMLAGVVELPPTPIAIDQGWLIERSQATPEIGEIAASFDSRLGNFDAVEALVLSDVNASFPEFTSTNPLQDNQVTVRNGVLVVEEMERTIDVPAGLICAARGTMRLEGRAAIGEFVELPLKVTSTFTIERR